MTIVLEMKSIKKHFGGVKALNGIDFVLKKGEVHALLGENGAGKSTLIKVLGGIHIPDEGEIYINNEKADITSVYDAQKYGIGIIHQEIVLVPHLTVAENIFLGREPITKLGFVDYEKMVSESTKMIEKLGLNINVSTLVGGLTIAQQQLVEITKAVSFDIDILVMDEPTSSLTGSDIEYLFKTIEKLKASGISIIYISHRFEELFEITDKITVIRDGVYIDTVDTKSTHTQELVKLMVGREIENLYTRTKGELEGKELLRVDNLSKNGELYDISFHVNSGEIVGFSGLVGSGRSELMLSIFGANDIDSGEIYFDSEKVNINSPKEAIDLGIGLVPEDRKKLGLILENSISFNTSLSSIDDMLTNKIFVDEKRQEEIVEEYSKKLNVKMESIYVDVINLSGGNQQKVVLAKWLLTNPKLLILDEPTRGVDVGAKSEIYSIINNLANQGIGIIMVSSDLPEILNMTDRTYVMREGNLVKSIAKEEMTQENIMYYATGGDIL